MLRVLSHDVGVDSVAFSPDGTTLASGSTDSTVRLWDLTQPDAAPIILRGHDDAVRSVAFSLDGATLASGSNDYTVRVWDLMRLDVAPTIHNHEDVVHSVVFSPDGAMLASGSWDTTVRLWEWRTDLLAEQVCERVWRNLTWQEWRQFVSIDMPYERTCPNLPVHPDVLEEGQTLAKDGNIEGAIAIFQRVLELEPDIDFNPQTEATMWAMLGNADRLVQDGNTEETVALFQQALTVDFNSSRTSLATVRKWASQRLITQGETLAQDGHIDDATTMYAEAQALDPTLYIGASQWNTLCWFGSLWGHAADVLDVCDKAVARESRRC